MTIYEDNKIKIDCKIYHECRQWHHCWRCKYNKTIERLDNYHEHEKGD